jgi:hypothetical protein
MITTVRNQGKNFFKIHFLFNLKFSIHNLKLPIYNWFLIL